MTMAAGLIPYGDWLPFLAELAAKATVVLLLTAVVAALLWRSSAAVRHLVWCMGIVGVLTLPLFSLLLPAWELPLLPAREAAAPALYELPAAVMEAKDAAPGAPAELAAAPRADLVQEAASAGMAAWLPRAAAVLGVTGVAAGLLWLALGFWGVSRLERRAEVVRDPEWLRTAHEAAAQLGLRRPVLLLRNPGPGMPATGGLLWPVVVVPESAEAWSDDRRRAVLAHELAHVKRFDCLTQAMAQVACALFWWHPAVWYAARRLRVERERACDDLVLRAGTRASDYASHLLEIARAHRSMRMAAPALVSMARPSQLESRLLWVLDAARSRGVPSSRATVAAMAAALLAVGSLSALRPTPAQAARANGDEAPARAGAAAGQAPRQASGDGPRLAAGSPAVEAAPEAGDHDRLKVKPGRHGRAGDTIPSVDDLVAMRAVGVDAAYIAELRAAGFTGLTPHQLVSLRANGVTRRYAEEMSAVFAGLTAEQLIGLAGLRVTPAYVDELRRHGYGGLTVDQVSGMRGVRVDGAWIEEMAGAGYRRVPAEQLIGMRGVAVDAGYVQELARAGLRNLSAETLTGLRSVRVDGEYIAELRGAGLAGLDAETLIGMRAVGVTPAYIRELAEVGLAGLSAGRLTTLRANGIDAAYVREVRAAGLTADTAEQLVQLRASGVDRELMDARKKRN